MKTLFEFNRRRWRAFAIILGIVYGLAFAGVWVAVYIPILGAPFFLAGLMVWYLPGVVFIWTGFFKFHEFGAAPAGWEGHLVMLLFYALLAAVLSWPFGRKKNAPPPAETA